MNFLLHDRFEGAIATAKFVRLLTEITRPFWRIAAIPDAIVQEVLVGSIAENAPVRP
jgi:hypothetical protein